MPHSHQHARARKYISDLRMQFRFHCTLLIYSHHACIRVLLNWMHASCAHTWTEKYQWDKSVHTHIGVHEALWHNFDTNSTISVNSDVLRTYATIQIWGRKANPNMEYVRGGSRGNVHYICLRNANKAEYFLALTLRPNRTRYPKQGYQWPQNRLY